MDALVNISGLSKYYGRIKALDDFSLQIPRGSSFGILGPNGSGKTTLLGMLLSITQPNKGSFEWKLKQFPETPRLGIGALLETPNFYPYLNAVDNLRIVTGIKQKGDDEILDKLTMVNLFERRKSKFQTYSLGMKQRLAIAAAMCGDPEVLIFDEPTNGLDPEGIAEIRTLIQQIAEQGKTIIMASHILDEVEKICSHVAIIRKGKLLQHGTVGSILHDNTNIFEIKAADLRLLEMCYIDQPAVEKIEKKADALHIYTSKAISSETVNQIAWQKGIVLSHLVLKKRKLEEEFLSIIKNS